MTTRVIVSGLDYTNEPTSTGFYMIDLTAANFDQETADAIAVQAAIQGVSLIDFLGIAYKGLDTPRENVPPADSEAQRELKFLITYVDDVTGEKGSLAIGGANTTLLVQNTDNLNLAAGAGGALKTALETHAVSKAGNSITVVAGKLVGRTI